MNMIITLKEMDQIQMPEDVHGYIFGKEEEIPEDYEELREELEDRVGALDTEIVGEDNRLDGIEIYANAPTEVILTLINIGVDWSYDPMYIHPWDGKKFLPEIEMRILG